MKLIYFKAACVHRNHVISAIAKNFDTEISKSKLGFAFDFAFDFPMNITGVVAGTHRFHDIKTVLC